MESTEGPGVPPVAPARKKRWPLRLAFAALLVLLAANTVQLIYEKSQRNRITSLQHDLHVSQQKNEALGHQISATQAHLNATRRDLRDATKSNEAVGAAEFACQVGFTEMHRAWHNVQLALSAFEAGDTSAANLAADKGDSAFSRVERDERECDSFVPGYPGP